MNKKRGPNSKIWQTLSNEGPQPRNELGRVGGSLRQDGVRKFYPTANSQGGAQSGMFKNTVVYFIENKHQPETVVQAWLDANPHHTEVSEWALHQRIAEYGEGFRAASYMILGPFDDVKSGAGGTTDVDCPWCGKDVDQLPRHLPCDES